MRSPGASSAAMAAVLFKTSFTSTKVHSNGNPMAQNEGLLPATQYPESPVPGKSELHGTCYHGSDQTSITNPNGVAPKENHTPATPLRPGRWHSIEQMAGYVTTTATVGDGALSPPALCAMT